MNATCPRSGKPAKREFKHEALYYCSGTCVAAVVNDQVRQNTMRRLNDLGVDKARIDKARDI